METSFSQYVEPAADSLSKSDIVNFEAIFASADISVIADKILESTYENVDPMKRDLFDKFLDFVYFKTQTGEYEILNMAYPTKRMRDRDLEKMIITLLNFGTLDVYTLKGT